MKTLNEEIIRIKSEIVEITNKAFTGKTIQEQVGQQFSEIIMQEHNTNEKKG